MQHFRHGILSLAIIVLALAAIRLDLIFQGQKPAGILFPDSNQYIEFSQAILSGEIWGTPKDLSPQGGLVVRTPGYPIILALGQIIFSKNVAVAMYGVHILVGLAVILVYGLIFRRIFSPLLLTTGLLLFMSAQIVFFGTLMTEWLAFCLTLLIFPVGFWVFQKPKFVTYFLFSVLCGYAVLTRPALAGFLALPFLVLYLNRNWKIKLFGAVVLGLMPVVIWLGFNLKRLGTPSLAAYGGTSAYGYAALLGTMPESFGETAERDQFQRLAQETQTIVATGRFIDVPLLRSTELAHTWAGNLDRLAGRLHSELGWNQVKIDRVMGQAALSIVSNNLGKYLIVVGLGALTLVWALVPLIFFLGSGYRLRNASLELRGLWFAGGLIFAAHLLHTLLVMFIGVMYERYLVMTLLPVYMVTLLMVWVGHYSRSAKG